MKLEDFFIGHARLLVQVVYVLGDNTVQFPQLIQFGNGVMGRVGLGLGDKALPHELPLLSPGFG